MAIYNVILLLFDIDGTLLSCPSGVHLAAFTRAGQEVFDPNFCSETTDHVGQLDPVILKQALAAVHHEATAHEMSQFKDLYFKYLSQATKRAIVLPGVFELLDLLEQFSPFSGTDRPRPFEPFPDCCLGLVTGNFRNSAQIKLDGNGLRFDRFSVGGFGDIGTTRSDLVCRAIQEATQKLGFSLSPQQVIVIGDTSRDILSAKTVNCRSIAVLTGCACRTELENARPDLILNDLTEQSRFMSFIQNVANF